MITPEKLHYSKSHEWVRVDGNELVIGITDHAQSELGDVVYVELPEIGATYSVEEECGMIDSAKTTSPLVNPVAGTVTRINENLSDSPELVNTSPYDKGWMYAIEPENPSDIEKLMDAKKYAEYVKSGK